MRQSVDQVSVESSTKLRYLPLPIGALSWTIQRRSSRSFFPQSIDPSVVPYLPTTACMSSVVRIRRYTNSCDCATYVSPSDSLPALHATQLVANYRVQNLKQGLQVLWFRVAMQVTMLYTNQFRRYLAAACTYGASTFGVLLNSSAVM